MIDRPYFVMLFLTEWLALPAGAQSSPPDPPSSPPRLWAPGSQPYGTPYAEWLTRFNRLPFELPKASNPFWDELPDHEQVCGLPQSPSSISSTPPSLWRAARSPTLVPFLWAPVVSSVSA